MKAKQSLVKSTVIVYMLQGVAMLLAFCRSMVFANFFGTTIEADAYNVALKIPTVLFAVIATAIKTVAIPLYSKQLYEKGKKEADCFYSNLLTLSISIAICFSALCMVFSQKVVFLFAPGLNAEAFALASKLVKFFSITVGLLSIINIQEGILNVYRKYTYAKAVSEISLVIRIISLILLAGSLGIYSAIIGYLIGTLVTMILSSVGTAKVAKYRVLIDVHEDGISQAFKSSLPVILGVGVAEINRVVDGNIASFFSPGSISSLNYALTLESSIGSFCLLTINNIFYPVFAKHIAQNNTTQLNRAYNTVLSIVTYIAVPVFIGGFILCDAIVSIMYCRGAFSPSNVPIVSNLFVIYLAGILFSGLRKTATNILYAKNDTKRPMIYSTISVVMNIVLNLVLSRFFGIRGLAIATTISVIVATVLMLRSTQKHVEGICLSMFFRSIWKSVAGGAIMGGAVWISNRYVNINLYVDFIITFVIGVTVYIAALYTLKVEEMNTVFNKIKQKLRPKSIGIS